VLCVSALCESGDSALAGVSDEVVSPKSVEARDRLRSSSSVASPPQSPRSSDELGTSLLLPCSVNGEKEGEFV